MLLDLTLPVTPAMLKEAKELNDPALEGHLGTHFDVMDKEFPLEYTERQGILFDVSRVEGEEIGMGDVDLSRVKAGTFVAFYSGYGEKVAYGATGYFSKGPMLSYELIQALLEKQVSVIGLDFGGIRRGKEHIPADQVCADRGVFVVENLVNLHQLPEEGFTVHTYPMAFLGITGLPCRVVAEI